MTNFDGEAPVISDVEAKEIALQLSGQSLRSKSIRKPQQQQQQQHELKEMDAGTISYLQATYSQLHENQVRKLNDILAMNDGVDEERTSAKRVKRRLKKMEVVDGGDDDDDDQCQNSCQVNELAREMQNMQFSQERLRPIITFTPVLAAGEGEHHQLEDCRGRRRVSPASSFSDHASSGSSSPLLEVPMCEFPNMTAEMMRPPFH